MAKNKHTGISMGGTMVYRNLKPRKETFGPYCYQCVHLDDKGYCQEGTTPFFQENMEIAKRCKKFKYKSKKQFK